MIATSTKFPGSPGHRPRLLGGLCVSRVCFFPKVARYDAARIAPRIRPACPDFRDSSRVLTDALGRAGRAGGQFRDSHGLGLCPLWPDRFASEAQNVQNSRISSRSPAAVNKSGDGRAGEDSELVHLLCCPELARHSFNNVSISSRLYFSISRPGSLLLVSFRCSA